jgi:hypothetical protein
VEEPLNLERQCCKQQHLVCAFFLYMYCNRVQKQVLSCM